MPQIRLLILFFFVSLLHSCVPISQQTTGGSDAGTAGGAPAAQALRFEDYVYDPNVRSVQCYVQSGHPEQVLNPPVIPITQEQPIVLEFDQLNVPQQRYLVKFIYCNADWTEARITQQQYMQDFNEFYITDISPSFNTKVPFFHYKFRVPLVKLSGNYLLVVTDQNGRNILSQRMMVYDQKVTISAKPTLTTGGDARFTNQQVDFNISYNQFPLVNPAQEVKVIMRQNYRWDNAKQNLRPLNIRDTERRLEYKFFELQHTFPGLNEFRFFDNRSRRFSGANVAKANREVVPEEIMLIPDINRSKDAYSQQIDINGRFIFGNRDFGNEAVNGDYNWVIFSLQAPQQAPGDVYIFGELSDWKLKPEFKLTYDATNQLYTGRALLKQGYYNYYYALGGQGTAPNEAYFEGTFNTTENNYDILVYYRPPGARTDLLIGYETVTFNGRR